MVALLVIHHAPSGRARRSRELVARGAAAPRPRPVEEVFTRAGRLLELTVAGRTLPTTPEHPFFVRGRGWTAAGELAAGDQLSTATGAWLPVESLTDTGREQTVHNFRVADDHTYFIAPSDLAFDVWVHNSYNPLRPNLGLKPGDPEFAAHVVPKKGFKRDAPGVMSSIEDAREILERNNVPIDSWYNGFRSSRADHHGTHRNLFLSQLGPRLAAAELGGGQPAILNELNTLKLEALSGEFL